MSIILLLCRYKITSCNNSKQGTYQLYYYLSF